MCARPSAPPPSNTRPTFVLFTGAGGSFARPAAETRPTDATIGGCVCPHATATTRGTTDNRTVSLIVRFRSMPEPPTKTARSVYTSILVHAHTLVVDCQSTCDA